MQKIWLNCKIKFSFFVLLITFSLFITACTTAKNVTSIDSIGKNDVLIVGKIILEPSLSKDELKTPYSLPMYTIYGKSGNINIYFQDTLTSLTKLEVGMKESINSISTEFDKTFFIKIKRKPIYLYYGYIIMGYDSDLTDSFIFHYLPAGWKLNISDQDKAIYIGTIKYTRDEFFRIKKLEVIDEYDTIVKEYEAKFGTKLPLKKSILLPIE